MTFRGALAAVVLAVLALPALAQRPIASPTPAPAASDEAKPADKDRERKTGDEKPPKEEKPVATKHSVTIGGKAIGYTATAGYMAMKDESGKLKANIFFVAYTKDGGGKGRPVTFTFKPSLEKMTKDVAAFYASAAPEK